MPLVCLGLPLRRTVIAVERIGVALAERKDEADVRFGGSVEIGRSRCRAMRTTARDSERGDAHDDDRRAAPPPSRPRRPRRFDVPRRSSVRSRTSGGGRHTCAADSVDTRSCCK